ncbi:aminoacyl-tRNA hydrolase [Anaeromassilibacillus senegalensis]|uniref:Peptidyl-tRNA hydrolase n=1 Tax=Anaeromassilibacillus senegalensis TaxID=1673717 RepID=A0ABS9MKI8_9FIRM|nr:aminoacyl-tRNA hydrolase [Anaeromassilibacillus senegalensis]MCG4611321.1 aminoacyl-tRNA hydrolase [Anaeromassilibacillus senegalensis]
MFQKFFRRPAPVTGPVEYLVVGLGNPGSKYDGTRHNTGFMAIDRIAEKAGVQINRLKFKGLCARAEVGGKSVLLLKPSTFMNLSGQSVQEAMQFYKLPAEKVIVLFDDISLPVGRMRIRMKGSDGGHNGMKNIIYLSGKDTFPRIKLGIGAKPNPGWDLADWVLSRFTEQEQKQLSDVFDHAAVAVALMVNGNSTEAMNRFNGA